MMTKTNVKVEKPSDLPADWYFHWEELAAVMEYGDGMEREEAEAKAFADTLDRMSRAWKRLAK